MISEKRFDKIKQRLGEYAHNSLEYEEYECVASFTLVCDTPELIALTGYSGSAKMHQLHWAASDMELVINAAKALERPAYLQFVPEDWENEFLKQGFLEYGVMRDYWIRELQMPAPLAREYEIAPIALSDCAAASDVTCSCRLQSREFQGETPRWAEEWITGREPNAAAPYARDHAILGVRENGVLAGVACICIYGDDNPDGAVVWLRELAVSPKYQGRGYGRALVAATLKYGFERNAKRSFLMADDCNQNARKLYISMGYKPGADVQIDLMLG